MAKKTKFRVPRIKGSFSDYDAASAARRNLGLGPKRRLLQELHQTPISLTYPIWLYCDGCYAALRVRKKRGHNEAKEIAKLERLAARVGWEPGVAGRWFCPRCSDIRSR